MTDSVIDQTVLDQIRAIDESGTAGLLVKIIEMYLDESARMQVEMAGAIEAGDTAALYQLAHTLKSTSANVGAMKVSDVSKCLEDCGRSGELDNALDLFRSLEAENNRAMVELQGIANAA